MLADRVTEALARIRAYARETPLLESPALSREAGARILLKLENLQHTGSFKLRGALNKMLSLDAEARARGVITASTGNHGAATAYAGRIAGVAPTVYVPAGAVESKVARIRELGGEVVVHGTDSGESELFARAEAERQGKVYLSPYNDWDVVAGQGTIGVELEQQCPDLAAVVVSVGGGGLIGGIAGYLAERMPGVDVVGCSPVASHVMAASVAAGRLLDLPSEPTLSDGTAGGVEPDAITFDLCRRLVKGFDLVTEPDIAAAMRRAFHDEHLVIEGAAGVAIASALRQAARWPGRPIAIVLCGGNVDLTRWCGLMGEGRN